MVTGDEQQVAFMKSQSTIEPNGEITSEACAWVAQLDSGQLSSSDMAALREWMGRSPAHAREIRSIAELSGQLAVLTDLSDVLEKSAGVTHELRRRQRSPWRHAQAFAAALAFVIVAGVLVSALVFNTSASQEIYKTAVGEYLTIALSDGTEVSLNTDSQIKVDFNEDERRIRLINGEVLFDVASNPNRPFVVYSDTAVAEAVGTSFVVRLKNTVTELAVVEGIVAFSMLPPSIDVRVNRDITDALRNETAQVRGLGRGVMVKAGQALTSLDLEITDEKAPVQEITVLTERDLLRKLSWTDGFLEFSQTPLEDVVEELTRHNPVTIEIADPDLRELEFGGIFRTGDVEQLLSALEGLGVVVERKGDNQYQLKTAEAD